MENIFKTVFMSLYSDNLGFSWLFWMILLCFILLPIFVYVAIKTYNNLKSGNKNVLKFAIPFGICCFFAFYQLIPVYLNFCGVTKLNEKCENLAIKTAIFPYQKGAYYCNLANIKLLKKDYREIGKSYELAYSYLKSYDYPCWGLAFLYYKTVGDYKTAIKAAQGLGYSNKHFQVGMLAILYIMDEDYENALKYINTYIEKGTSKNLHEIYARRGFIYRKLKQEELAKKDLRKALSLANSSIKRQTVYSIYNNFRNNELKRENEARKRLGV